MKNLVLRDKGRDGNLSFCIAPESFTRSDGCLQKSCNDCPGDPVRKLYVNSFLILQSHLPVSANSLRLKRFRDRKPRL